MRGSLENPPLVVSESWFSRVLAVLVAALFSGFTLLPGGAWTEHPLRSAALVAAVWSLCIWHFCRPVLLEIWPDRIVKRDVFGFRNTYRFTDISEFVVVYGSRGRVQVGFNWAEDSPRRTGVAAFMGMLSAVDVPLGGSWEMGPQDLVDLLNRTRLLPSAWR